MELVKNIFFNTDKLIENTKVKISYSGKLFEDGAQSVFIHYGFGINWDNVSEVEMIKTELGFQAEISLQSSDSLNLCFRNNENIWDNNDNKNYSFPIEKSQEVALVVTDMVSAIDTPRRLRKSYLWGKKIKLAMYKIVHYLPKIISGNYKRKVITEK
jgi:hypothetical protein